MRRWKKVRRHLGTAPQWLRVPAQRNENNYARERSDPFVPGTMIERFGLREGVHDEGDGPAGSTPTGPTSPRDSRC